ncbi:twin-arginine translocase TatA/TatE family subunit [Actinoalloteichus sp. AHMU CJ021]|uniref:Sec-independent protein translocase subunit TatA n=1 Tax=Actinoalloteichus TaxID=65496 RepID=UPI00041E6B43|nr:Sec-independent protein translocase subunit TatA [Actinoalloteichus caeruleus]AUS80671.1 twin-arginine translocase TatA/TatE family subunit [Actinoalloteichus sp. AHMU CJ021]
MPNIGTAEILIIAVVLVLLFGATKLPAMARSLGQSARILKAEVKGMKRDGEPRDGTEAPQSAPAAPVAPAVAPAPPAGPANTLANQADGAPAANPGQQAPPS